MNNGTRNYREERVVLGRGRERYSYGKGGKDGMCKEERLQKETIGIQVPTEERKNERSHSQERERERETMQSGRANDFSCRIERRR